jgi:iron complex outermembrane receptor protein
LLSAFTQDEFAFLRQRLRLTVGSKFEHNDYTGFEMEPNARLLWTATSKQSVWTAISRAVRTPARTEQNVRLNANVIPPSEATLGLPLLATVLGDVHFKSEDLVAYEAGYRIQLGSAFSADFATFYNSYSNLLSAEPRPVFLEMSPAPVHLMMPLVAENKRSGATHGVELFAEWKGIPKWKLAGSYSFLSMDIHNDPNSLDTTSVNPAGSSPQHQYYLRSSLDLSKQFEQDITLRYVHSLDGLAIPSYHSLDARIGWKPTANVEFAVNGQNLTNNRHLEFRPDFISTSPTQVKRTFYGSLTFKF